MIDKISALSEIYNPHKKTVLERISEYRQKNLNADKVNEITDYGNGILYFQAERGYDRFGKLLSKYLKENPTLKIISIAPYDDVNGLVSGITVGYFVIIDTRANL